MRAQYEALTPEQKIEMGEAAKRVIESDDWKKSIGFWLKYRMEVLRELIDTAPIFTEEQRMDFQTARQELLAWNFLTKKPAELIATAKDLLKERQPGGE